PRTINRPNFPLNPPKMTRRRHALRLAIFWRREKGRSDPCSLQSPSSLHLPWAAWLRCPMTRPISAAVGRAASSLPPLKTVHAAYNRNVGGPIGSRHPPRRPKNGGAIESGFRYDRLRREAAGIPPLIPSPGIGCRGPEAPINRPPRVDF